MREIKFKFIVERDGVKYLTKPYTLTNEDGLPPEEQIIEDMEGECTCSLNESVNCCEGGCMEWENAEVVGKLQYTGLKSKSGVEIYEGDILLTKYNYQATIEWRDGSFTYSTENLAEHIRKQMSDSRFVACDFCCSEDEVIGNIYENKELLK